MTTTGSLAEARELLFTDYAAALEVYRELQVENPDLKEAVFGAGCALYKQGEAHLSLGVVEEAVSAFDEARSTFEGLVQATDVELAVGAAFNRANCLTQKAKLVPVPEQHATAIEAYREAVSAYEAVLQADPGHESATRNLDHVRYLLKVLLQNPPVEQEPPDPPTPVALLLNPTTEIPGANAHQPDESVVQLFLCESKGVQP